MTAKYNGGPAFPTEPRGIVYGDAYDGMTMRDWFAGQATDSDIKELMRIYDSAGRITDQYRTREQARYAFADLMLEARK